MIKFRQKNYAIPAIVSFLGSTAAFVAPSLIQGSKQQKENVKLQKSQEEVMLKHNKLLEEQNKALERLRDEVSMGGGDENTFMEAAKILYPDEVKKAMKNSSKKTDENNESNKITKDDVYNILKENGIDISENSKCLVVPGKSDIVFKQKDYTSSTSSSPPVDLTEGSKLIKFGKKAFMPTILVVDTVSGHKNLVKTKKENKEIIESNKEFLRNLDKQIEELSEKNREAEEEEREFSGTLVGNALKSSKIFGRPIVDNLVMGTGFGIAAYGGNKVIQGLMKKDEIGIDEEGNMYFINGDPESELENPNPVEEEKKYRRKKEKNFSGGGIGRSLLSGIGLGSLFSIPVGVVGYRSDKNRLKEQIEATKADEEHNKSVREIREKKRQLAELKRKNDLRELGISEEEIENTSSNNEREFSAVDLRPFGRRFLDKAGGFLHWGVGGESNVVGFGKNLEMEGILTNNKASVDVGKWIQENPGKANLISFAPLIPIGQATFNIPEEAISTLGKELDPDAYKYEESKNKVVEE